MKLPIHYEDATLLETAITATGKVIAGRYEKDGREFVREYWGDLTLESTPHTWVKTYCLFAGRHDMPENSGPLFSGVTFDTFECTRTEHYEEAMQSGEFRLYCTGLTAAALTLLHDAMKRGVTIHFLHYNRETGDYVTQKFQS